MLENGLTVRQEIEGNDQMKDAVRETFSAAAGSASWKSKAEQGTAPGSSRPRARR